MKKELLVLFCSITAVNTYSQKVGIGTNTPDMKLHVQSTDSAVLQLTNSTALDENTSLGLYFKNGDWYTGALRSMGTGSNSARLSLFTYAGMAASALKERLSITDGGRVGINITEPAATLHVSGTQIISNDAPYSTPALNVSSALTTATIPAVQVQASSTGIITGTLSPAGAGLVAWNGQEPSIQAGTGITAHSTNGNAIYAQSVKANSFSVFATSTLPNVTAGRFQNTGGGKALVTSGAIQIEGQGAGAGKVLTSDAAGNATWQNAGSPCTFSGWLTNSFLLSPGSTFPVSGITALDNTGNALNSNAGEFTAPSAGWYQFTVNLLFTLPSAEMRMAIDFLKNGGSQTGSVFPFLIVPSAGGQLDSRTVSHSMRLAAGDKVSFQFRHTGGTGSITLFGGLPATTVTMFYGVKM